MAPRALTDEYYLDADRLYASDPHAAVIFQLNDESSTSEGRSSPFGFAPRPGSAVVGEPEPWMWWLA